ncbi:hypothetical protein ACO0LD_13835 [Undibacterium sp. Ji83W]|uniref:hypothetical protein n=1 Tax=Undibacterium sp. Ji83W TaxID=3413043 RepID=UPI003BF22226
MSDWAFVATGLALAGFVYGWWRKPPGAGKRSYLSWIMAFIFAAPIGSLLLANLFGSAVLGWIFGLSLMFVWPLAILFIAGNAAGALLAQRNQHNNHNDSSDSNKHESPMLHIRIDRDSVHAGDDTVSHAENIAVPANTSLASLLEQIRVGNFLPSISGGKATWMIESSGSPFKTIGVLAQQWQEPCVIIDAAVDVAQHFAGQQANLFFRYRCQIDPDTVLAQLQASYTNSISQTPTHGYGGIASLAKHASYLRSLMNPGSDRC